MLALVLAVAAGLRLLPHATYAVWGSDTGEYLYLTRHLVDHGRMPADYQGWGFAYPLFPGMEALAAGASLLTGADALAVLRVLVPLLNVLVVAGVFLVGRRVFDRRSGLWAAALAAVAMPLVFTGSHPMPEALAHGLAVLVVWLALDADRPARLAAAFGLALAVVWTHHLTSYFLVLALLGLWLGPLLARRRDPGWPRLALALSVGAAAFLYWTLLAPPFAEFILGLVLPVPVLAGLVLAGAVLLVLVARFRHRVAWSLPLRDGDPVRARRLGVALFAAALVVTAAFVLVGVPGVSFRMDPAAVPWTLPLAGILLAVPLGTARARATADGVGVYLWLGLVGASFVAGAVVAPQVLIPYRHVPFLLVPVSLLAGRGIVEVVPPLPEDWPRRRPLRALTPRRLAPVVLAVLLALTAYPPATALAGFQEGVTSEELAAVRWAGETLPDEATFLADHRLSSLLFGVAGMRPSWDSGAEAWFAPSFEEARPHLVSLDLPSGTARVDYVLVSPTTVQGVALAQWDPARPLEGPALDKFDEAPFQPIYDRDGVRIYRIVWDAVE